MHPFLFGFSGGPVERELIENEKTNEELVICNVDLYAMGMSVAIYRNRSVKEKKNSHETE